MACSEMWRNVLRWVSARYGWAIGLSLCRFGMLPTVGRAPALWCQRMSSSNSTTCCAGGDLLKREAITQGDAVASDVPSNGKPAWS